MGTFNDPNQFAFYIFASFLLIYAANIIIENKSNHNFIFFSISLILIYESLSTGMLLGILSFGVLWNIYNFFIVKKVGLRSIFYSISATCLIVSILLLLNLNIFGLRENSGLTFKKSGNQQLTERVSQKLSLVNGSSKETIFQERGYDTIYKYPKNIIFGAGDGLWTRFPQSHNELEVHAFLPALLFYYGIFPFFFLLWWLYNQLKNINRGVLIAIIALLVESFTLANYRQSLFWILLILGSLYPVISRGRKNEI